MRISIFLSCPKPHLKCQEAFLASLVEYLKNRGLEPRTLGVTDYDMDAPLKAIRRLMLESNGLITIAFKRTYIDKATVRLGTDISKCIQTTKANYWLTSPYCQIEPAMAYQLGLPILVLREKDVSDEGLLEKGVVGLYMPEFSLDDSINQYLESEEWKQIIGKWEGLVRAVIEYKGNPPKMF
jgi:hypothetical protein